MGGVGGGLLSVLVIVLGVGVYLAVWFFGHFVLTAGIPCLDLHDRVRLAWLWGESGRTKPSTRERVQWCVRKRSKARAGSASARFLDASQADALIVMDEGAAAIEVLNQIGEGGVRLGRIMKPGLLELKWVLVAARLGRYDEASRAMDRALVIRDDAVARRIAAGVEFLVSGDLERFSNADRRAADALRSGESDDRRRLRMQSAAVVMAARGDLAAFDELRARTGEFVALARSTEGDQIDRALALIELGRWAVLSERRDVVDEVTRALTESSPSDGRIAGRLAQLRGLRLGLDGDREGAVHALDEARAFELERDHQPRLAEVRLADAAVATFGGDRRAAQEALDDAVSRFRSMGSNGGVTESSTVAGLLGLDPPSVI